MTLKEQMDQEYSRGLEEGREEGIRVFILDKLQEGVAKEIITEKLVKLFEMSNDQAIEFIRKYT